MPHGLESSYKVLKTVLICECLNLMYNVNINHRSDPFLGKFDQHATIPNKISVFLYLIAPGQNIGILEN